MAELSFYLTKENGRAKLGLQVPYNLYMSIQDSNEDFQSGIEEIKKGGVA